MKFLGVPPGPIVGEALSFLLELRLEEGPMDEEESYAQLAEWARRRGIERGSPPDPT
jgi:poly(A) polymerase